MACRCAQEIDALFKGHKQNCVVYFLDETFEELQVGGGLGCWLRRCARFVQLVRAEVCIRPGSSLCLPPILQYDASTTVMEAVEQLASQIKLENYQTFSLFMVHKVRSGGEEPGLIVLGRGAARTCAHFAAGCQSLPTTSPCRRSAAGQAGRRDWRAAHRRARAVR